MAAEIVSPGSRLMDRLTKPAAYAGVGIPSLWRIELEDGPVIFAYGLQGGGSAELGAARPGEQLTVQQPFAISIDPADLRP